MSNQEDFLRKARMAALMAADDDKGKDVAPAENEDALVSEKTKENLKKAGALAAVAGRWGFGKAKEATMAAAAKASTAKAEFEAKRAAGAKRKAEESLAVETKALAEREAAVPVAEAPPMAVVPAGEDCTDTMSKSRKQVPTTTLQDSEEHTLVDIVKAKGTGFLTGENYPFAPDGDVESLAPAMVSEVPMVFDETSTGMTSNTHMEVAQQFVASADDTEEQTETSGASDDEHSGLLIMDGMGSLPATLSKNQIDILVLAPGQEVPFADISWDEVEAAGAALASATESRAPDAVLQGKASVGMTTIHQLAGFSNNLNDNKPFRKDRKEHSAVKIFWIMIAAGVISVAFVALIAFYVFNRATSAPVATPAPVAPQAAPVVVEPVILPIEAPVEEPAATVPEVVEAPAVVAPPLVSATPVVVPAPKPTPVAPVVQAPKPAPAAVVAKPKQAPVKPAPVVVAQPKPVPKVVDPVAKDSDKQLEEMEAWFEKQNQK